MVPTASVLPVSSLFRLGLESTPHHSIRSITAACWTGFDGALSATSTAEIIEATIFRMPMCALRKVRRVIIEEVKGRRKDGCDGENVIEMNTKKLGPEEVVISSIRDACSAYNSRVIWSCDSVYRP